jgi:hypothetical protein
VAKKLLTRLKEDGKSIVVTIDMGEREFLMEFDPKTFFTADHYRPWPTMLVNLENRPRRSGAPLARPGVRQRRRNCLLLMRQRRRLSRLNDRPLLAANAKNTRLPHAKGRRSAL